MTSSADGGGGPPEDAAESESRPRACALVRRPSAPVHLQIRRVSHLQDDDSCSLPELQPEVYEQHPDADGGRRPCRDTPPTLLPEAPFVDLPFRPGTTEEQQGGVSDGDRFSFDDSNDDSGDGHGDEDYSVTRSHRSRSRGRSLRVPVRRSARSASAFRSYHEYSDDDSSPERVASITRSKSRTGTARSRSRSNTRTTRSKSRARMARSRSRSNTRTTRSKSRARMARSRSNTRTTRSKSRAGMARSRSKSNTRTTRSKSTAASTRPPRSRRRPYTTYEFSPRSPTPPGSPNPSRRVTRTMSKDTAPASRSTRSRSQARGLSPVKPAERKRRSKSVGPPAKRTKMDASTERDAPRWGRTASPETTSTHAVAPTHSSPESPVEDQTRSSSKSPVEDLMTSTLWTFPAKDQTSTSSTCPVQDRAGALLAATAIPQWLSGAAKMVASLSGACARCDCSGFVTVCGTAYFDLCDCLAGLDGVDRVGALGWVLWTLSGTTLKLESVRFRLSGSEVGAVDALLRTEARALRRVDARFVPAADRRQREDALSRQLGEMAGVVRQLHRRRPDAPGPWCPFCLLHGVALPTADHREPPCQYLFCWCWSCQSGSPYTRDLLQQHGVNKYLAVKVVDMLEFPVYDKAVVEGDSASLDDGEDTLDDDLMVVHYLNEKLTNDLRKKYGLGLDPVGVKELGGAISTSAVQYAMTEDEDSERTIEDDGDLDTTRKSAEHWAAAQAAVQQWSADVAARVAALTTALLPAAPSASAPPAALQPANSKTASPDKATSKTASPDKPTSKTASLDKDTSKTASPDKATSKTASPDKATSKTASPDKATFKTASADKVTTKSATLQPSTPKTASREMASPEMASPEMTSPEMTSPEMASPEMASPEMASPEMASPEMASPEMASPEMASPEMASPEMASPEIASPEMASPEMASPEMASPEMASPEMASPEMASPEMASPEMASPEMASPEMASPKTASPKTASPKTTLPKTTASLETDALNKASPEADSLEMASLCAPRMASPQSTVPQLSTAQSTAPRPATPPPGTPPPATPPPATPPPATPPPATPPPATPPPAVRPTVIVSPASCGPPLCPPSPASASAGASSPPRPPPSANNNSSSRMQRAGRRCRGRSSDGAAVPSEHLDLMLDSHPKDLAVSIDRGARFCGRCRNHSLAARLAGHSCPFRECPCALCGPGSAGAPRPAVRQRHCPRCRNHGQLVPLAGHRGKCARAECTCPQCARGPRRTRATSTRTPTDESPAALPEPAAAPAAPAAPAASADPTAPAKEVRAVIRPPMPVLVLATGGPLLPPPSTITPPSSLASLSPVLHGMPSPAQTPLSTMSPPWTPSPSLSPVTSPSYDSADEPLACRWCRMQCADRAELETHSETHVTPDAGAENESPGADPSAPAAEEASAVQAPEVVDNGGVEEAAAACSECGLGLATRLELARHHLDTHLAPGVHECAVCQACFSSRTRLRVHASYEHHGLSLACVKCAGRFPSMLLLRAHLLLEHKTPATVSCPLCSVECATAAELDAHLGAGRDGGLPAATGCSLHCEVCADGPFPGVRALLAHHDDHLADVRARHCAVCVAWFPTTELLQVHESDAHGDPLRFDCPVAKCGVFAPTADALSLHQFISHKRSRRYACLCGKRFSQLNKFQQHAVASLHMVVLQPSRRHSCACCGLSSEDRLHIKDHEDRDHMGLLTLDRVAQLMTLMKDAQVVSAAAPAPAQ